MRALILFLGLIGPLAMCGSGIDSGGSKTTVGNFQNHGSIGGITSLGTSSGGHLLSHAGLIEVLYAVPTTDALDSDNDGMPDAWELENGLSVGVDDSTIDTDKDGASNLMEYLAGTDPNDPNSVYRPAITTNGTTNGTTTIISMESVLGRHYRLYVSVDLVNWEVWDNLAGTGGQISFSFDQTSAVALSLLGVEELPKYFFRIELSLAP